MGFPFAPVVIGAALKSKLPQIVFDSVIDAISTINANPRVPIEIKDPRVVEQLAQAVTKKVEQAPEVKHQASTEKWWQKRSNWSWIVSVILAPTLGLAGYTLSAEHQEWIALGLFYAGNLISGYLARRAGTATKPLFMK